MVANFTYPTLKQRVVTDPRFDRFIWDTHNFGTAYKEPYERVAMGRSQGYIPETSVKPIRIFTLSFPVMLIEEPSEKASGCLQYQPELDFSMLRAFYVKHQTFKPFIYPHPIYGDIIVRFLKPLTLPKKNKDSGTVQSFNLELIEIVTTDYNFNRGEDFSGDLPLHIAYYDVEIEYPDTTFLFPMGGNYVSAFEDPHKPIRKFKLSCTGLQYFLNDKDELVLDYCTESNMALLEVFYLKMRLNTVFNFNYLGEDIPVRFDEPLNIPMVSGNTGVISDLDITFIETPDSIAGFTILDGPLTP